MPADYSRIHRLLKVLTLIQSSPDWTPKRLAQECQTTERSIYRDIKALIDAGVPVTFDRQVGGYAVRKDFFLPPVALTLDESLALVALAEHVGNGQIPFLRPAARAVAKLRCNLPAQIQHEVLESHMAIHLPAVQKEEEGITDVYERVRAAIVEKKALWCTYEAASNPMAEERDEPFLFKPYVLYFSQRAWYTIGFHMQRKAVRCLKLVRFSSCRRSDVSYIIPKTFSLEKHLGNAWRMIRGETTYEVELEFDRAFAETVADTHWHKTQEVIWQEDESIVFRCTVDGLDEIVWWVLSMGPHCVVRKPLELAERVRDLAREMAGRYESKDQAGKASKGGRTARAAGASAR